MRENTVKVVKVEEKSTGRYIIVPADRIMFIDCNQRNRLEGTGTDYRLCIGIGSNGSVSEPLTLSYKDEGSRDAEAEKIAAAMGGNTDELFPVSFMPEPKKYDVVFAVFEKNKELDGGTVRRMCELISDGDNCSVTIKGNNHTAYGLVIKKKVDLFSEKDDDGLVECVRELLNSSWRITEGECRLKAGAFIDAYFFGPMTLGLPYSRRNCF